MALKPTKYPSWAFNSELDPITLAPNKVEPTEEWKGSGQKRRQPLPRPYLNYNLDLLDQWIRWIDEQVSGSLSPTLEAAWPVGSVYYSTSTANPAVTFGFGTWTAIGQGRFVVGYNPGDADFNTVKKTGGSKTHTHGGATGGTTLTRSHLPAEGLDVTIPIYTGGGGGTTGVDKNPTADGNATYTTENMGSGQPHTHSISSASNLPPYIALVMWERTA